MPSAHSIFASARRLALDVEALVLPVVCLGCERHGAGIFCPQCAYAMRAIAPPQCDRCGQTRDHWERDSCGFCHAWPAALAWAASAVWFEDPARSLVHALKYGGWRVAAGPMAVAMVKHIGLRLRTADVLIPVPLGRLRRRERGHNQAELLARALGQELGVPVVTTLLARRRETRTQTRLHPSERKANVAGAFEVGRGAWGVVRGKSVILVDDVLTTGATLGAAAEALAAAGAAEVGAVTFARAVKPE